MVPQIEVTLDRIVNYAISDVLEIISPAPPKDNRFKFSEEQILRIMVLREIRRLSLRNVVKELYSNESYRKFCKNSNTEKMVLKSISDLRS